MCCGFHDDDGGDVVRSAIQADNLQENLVLTEAKKLEVDGLVNFIATNEVRYITEYNQMVGPTHCHVNVELLFSSCCLFLQTSFLSFEKNIFIEDKYKIENQ